MVHIKQVESYVVVPMGQQTRKNPLFSINGFLIIFREEFWENSKSKTNKKMFSPAKVLPSSGSIWYSQW